MEKTVLVGLSGGVDSAAVAKLLLEAGYRVSGAYLALCPWADPTGAARVAEKLGIPFTVVDRRRRFQKKVTEPFVEAYRHGQTPNPCVECNRYVKLQALIEEADRLGIEKVATGHYAGVEQAEDGRWQLLAARDGNKDQSYFLWRLTQSQLSRLLFPLTGLEKTLVRSYGEGLVPKKEKESMEICFIPDGDTKKYVEQHGGGMPAGDFTDREGRVLGKHKGIHCYTIGQRRGLGISAKERLFVTGLSSETGTVTLGTQAELLTERIRVTSLHYVSATRGTLPAQGIGMKGRNRGEPFACRLQFDRRGVTVYPEVPVRKFAPGQSACFYYEGKLLFGGVISEDTEKI